MNLFIADDVGLGKTIEAGLIARELLLRKKVREIVVACPPSMLLQWREELENRFGLHFEILDRDYFQNVRQERGFGVNPWTTNARFLVSHRLLIDEAYATPLRDWLGTFRPGSLLILDALLWRSQGLSGDSRQLFHDPVTEETSCAVGEPPTMKIVVWVVSLLVSANVPAIFIAVPHAAVAAP